MDKNTKYCFADTKEPIFFCDIPGKKKTETLWGWIDGTVEFHAMSEKDADELLAQKKIVTEDEAFSNLGNMFGSMGNLDAAFATSMALSPVKKKDEPKAELGVIKLPKTYDASLVNTDIVPDDLAAKLEIALKKEDRPSCISILFDGVPGTGKTMAACYIADKMGRKLKSHKLGELLGKYVGETEKQIQKAFDEAQTEGYILHFDEIDSIAGDRDKADRGYEIKAVNALLQCMDTYEGIFIATTNSKSGLDSAIKRRFLLKKEFSNVTSEQANKLAKLFFKRKAPTDLPNETLAPADFNLVKNSLLFVDDADITKKYIREQLLIEADERNGKSKSNSIGFL